MYIQITTRCNMSCDHCCMAATHCGEDMSLDTFKAALAWDSEYPTIGGGEPTLHPQFTDFLLLAITETEHPWLATNGSFTKTALMLAKLAKSGVIGCALSLDPYHDPIEQQVIDAFEAPSNLESDCREVRNAYGKELPHGRAADWAPESGCACPDLHVTPDGTVRGCGCADAPTLGNILDPDFSPPAEWEWGECSNKQPVTCKE